MISTGRRLSHCDCATEGFVTEGFDTDGLGLAIGGFAATASPRQLRHEDHGSTVAPQRVRHDGFAACDLITASGYGPTTVATPLGA